MDSSHSDQGEMVPHCGFDLHFSDNEWCWASFHLFVSHLYVFFEKRLFSSLAHFLIGWVVLLALCCMSCLYILEINPLSVVSFALIFFPFWGLSFHLAYSFLCCAAFKIYIIKERFIYSKRQILSNFRNLTYACNLVTTTQVEIQNISSSYESSLRPLLIQHPPHFNIVIILMILKLLIKGIIHIICSSVPAFFYSALCSWDS